ncbi:unnamed protein product [Chrysoparadoxa australica]
MEGWRQRFPYAPIGSKDDEKSRTRTCSLLLTIALLGCLALLWGSKRGVDEGQALTWSEVLVAREPGPHSEPLVQPLTRSSKDGLLETQLSITTARVSLGPLQYMTRLYEGLFPGPTLRVLPGDRIELDLINELEDPESCFPENAFACPNITNLHVHGMHVDPTGNADNIYRRAGPGESLHYTYHVPSNHYEGLFYYHPHNAGSSTVQDLSGMSGAIVVEDPPESPLASFRDIIMVLQEIDLTKLESNPYGSTLPLLQVDQVHDTGFPFMAVNGQFQPVLAVNPGERARLRLLHAGVSAYLSLSLEGCEMTTVARDGVLLATPRPSETILLVPGSRAEVLVSCPSEGTFVLEAGRKDDKAALQAAVGSRTKLVPAGSVAFIHATGETVVGNAVPPVLRDSSGLLANFNDYDSEDEGEPLGKFVLAFNEGPKVVRGDGTYSCTARSRSCTLLFRQLVCCFFLVAQDPERMPFCIAMLDLGCCNDSPFTSVPFPNCSPGTASMARSSAWRRCSVEQSLGGGLQLRWPRSITAAVHKPTRRLAHRRLEGYHIHRCCRECNHPVEGR